MHSSFSTPQASPLQFCVGEKNILAWLFVDEAGFGQTWGRILLSYPEKNMRWSRAFETCPATSFPDLYGTNSRLTRGWASPTTSLETSLSASHSSSFSVFVTRGTVAVKTNTNAKSCRNDIFHRRQISPRSLFFIEDVLSFLLCSRNRIRNWNSSWHLVREQLDCPEVGKTLKNRAKTLDSMKAWHLSETLVSINLRMKLSRWVVLRVRPQHDDLINFHQLVILARLVTYL